MLGPWISTTTTALAVTATLTPLKSPTAMEAIASTATQSFTSYENSYSMPQFIGPLHWTEGESPIYTFVTSSRTYHVYSHADHGDLSFPVETSQSTSIALKDSSKPVSTSITVFIEPSNPDTENSFPTPSVFKTWSHVFAEKGNDGMSAFPLEESQPTSTASEESNMLISTSTSAFIGPLNWDAEYPFPDPSSSSTPDYGYMAAKSYTSQPMLTASVDSSRTRQLSLSNPKSTAPIKRERTVESKKSRPRSAASEKLVQIVLRKTAHPTTTVSGAAAKCDPDWDINGCTTIISIDIKASQVSVISRASTCPLSPPVSQTTSEAQDKDSKRSTSAVIDEFRTIHGPTVTSPYRRPIATFPAIYPNYVANYSPGYWKQREIDWYAQQLIGVPLDEEIKLIDDEGRVGPTKLFIPHIYHLLPESMHKLKCPLHFHAEWIAWLQETWLIPGYFWLPENFPFPQGWPADWKDYPAFTNPPMRYILTKKEEDRFRRFLGTDVFDVVNKTLVIEDGDWGRERCIDDTWMRHDEL